MSASYFQAVIYIVVIAIYISGGISVFRKDIPPKKVLIAGISLLTLVWGVMTWSYHFHLAKICTGYDPCDFINFPILVVSFVLAALPLVIPLVWKGKDSSTQ